MKKGQDFHLPCYSGEKEALFSLRIFLLDLLDGGSLPGEREVFFLILAGVSTWLEEALNLDESTLLQEIQLWRAFLGAYLDVCLEDRQWRQARLSADNRDEKRYD